MRRCSNCASAWPGKAWWSAVPLLHPRLRPCPPPHPRLLAQQHSIRLRNLPGTLPVRTPCLAAAAWMAQAHAAAQGHAMPVRIAPRFCPHAFFCVRLPLFAVRQISRRAPSRASWPVAVLLVHGASTKKNRCGRAAVRVCAVASQSSVMRGRAWSARQAPFPFATHGLRHPLHGDTVGAAGQRACTQACKVRASPPHQRLKGAACTPCSSQFMPRICASPSVLPAGRVNLPS